jgi:hypothetical protein
MKLIKEEMDKRWILTNELNLNKQPLKEVWCFYSLYDLSLAICRITDVNFKKKNSLIRKLIENPSDVRTYNKIKIFMLKDVNIINKAMDIIEESKEGGVLMGDYKKPTMFAININE